MKFSISDSRRLTNMIWKIHEVIRDMILSRYHLVMTIWSLRWISGRDHMVTSMDFWTWPYGHLDDSLDVTIWSLTWISCRYYAIISLWVQGSGHVSDHVTYLKAWQILVELLLCMINFFSKFKIYPRGGRRKKESLFVLLWLSRTWLHSMHNVHSKAFYVFLLFMVCLFACFFFHYVFTCILIFMYFFRLFLLCCDVFFFFFICICIVLYLHISSGAV